MIWVAWRQHRLGIAGWLAVCLGVGIFAVVAQAIVDATVGVDLRCMDIHSYYAQHVSQCYWLMSSNGWAATVLRYLPVLVLVMPVIAGAFLGAPVLPAEYAARTHILAWSQGVSRRRWYWTKMALLVGAVSLGSAAIAAGSTLAHPYFESSWSIFDRVGVVPIGYSIFAFASGVLLGAVIRQPFPAMAAALVAFVVARLVVFNMRPQFLHPLVAYSLPRHWDGRWLLAEGFGQCNSGACQFLYQPAGRFPVFQGIEFTIFAAMAAVCLLVAYQLVLRRA